MAISYVNGGASNANNGGDVTVLFTGWGLQQNDLVLAVGAIGDNDDLNFTMAMTTSGYTLVTGTDLFSNDVQDTHLAVFYKFMGPTPDSSAVFTGQGGTDASCALAVMAFRGVDTSTPMDTSATTATGLNTYAANPPSISGSTSGFWTVACGAAGTVLGATAAFTLPTGYTTNAQGSSGNDTSDVTVAMGYNSSPATPEDPGSFTHNGTDSADYSWCAATLALRPLVLTAVTASESEPTGLTESLIVSVLTSSQEATQAGLSDSASIASHLSISDSGAVQVTEVAVPTILISTQDSIAVGITEAAVIADSVVSVLTADSFSVVVTETDISNFEIGQFDTTTVQVSDVTTAIVTCIAASDSLAVQVADVASLSSDTLQIITTSDTVNVTVAETDITNFELNIIESAAIGLTETATIGDAATNIAGSESIPLGVTETASAFVSIATNDSSSIGISGEVLPYVIARASTSDAVGLNESTTVVVYVATSDSISVQVTEGINNLSVRLATSDVLPAGLAEGLLSAIVLVASDGIQAVIDEALSVFATVAANDEASVIIAGSSSVSSDGLNTRSGLDTISVSITESGVVVARTVGTLSPLVATVEHIGVKSRSVISTNLPHQVIAGT